MEQSNYAESSNVNVVDSQPSTPVSTPEVSEKMLPQSHVNDIVKGIKHKYDNRLQEQDNRLKQYESELSTLRGQGTSTAPATAGTSNNTNLPIDEGAVKRLIGETLNSLYQENQAQKANESGQRIATEFQGKMKDGASKYEDFDDVVGHIPYQNIPEIVLLANEMENTSDIMYELGKNPTKIATLKQLVSLNPHDPALARRELKKLSDSLRVNDEAKQAKTAKAPLNQSKPSPTGDSNDGSSMSVSDFRRKLSGMRI